MQTVGIRVMKAVAQWRMFSLVAALAITVGCGSSDEHSSRREKLPITGELALQFIGASTSRMHLRLVNQSAQAISFRGTFEAGESASPWDTLLECRPSGTDIWVQGPFALIDGKEATVVVASGEQVDLVVDFKPEEQSLRGTCHLSIRMVDGLFIKSNDFHP
jgi:hypothetical protein